ncbi:DnaJ domain-containing protein [Seohaeicola zhoushanensis]
MAKTATQDEIRKAYRKLAKKLHPDLHPGDASKQAEFQAVTAAHDIIGDPEKRKRFDAGEIDASGQERPERQYYQQYADTGAGRRYDQAGPGGYEDLSDLFSDLFGNRQQGGGRRTYQEFDARGRICAITSRSISSMPRAGPGAACRCPTARPSR